jgi:hypothetical protein
VFNVMGTFSSVEPDFHLTAGRVWFFQALALLC